MATDPETIEHDRVELTAAATSSRKVEHVRLFEHDSDIDRNARHFDRIRLTQRALPELNLQDIDPSIEFLGRKLSFPLLISSMTGGDHELVCRINRNLAIAAQQTGVAMAVGSQRVMFERPAARESFALRQYAPDIPLLANVGAVQLNYGFGLAQCEEAISVMAADGIYLHLNALQEVIQPEGNTDFSGLLTKIGALRKSLSRPLFIKEVGCGLSDEDIANLVAQGIEYIDVAGQGGTSWSRIEHLRSRDGCDLGMIFQDWGIPTPQALRNAAPYRAQTQIIASGGLRSGIDMAKSVILGARLCGMAAPLLKPAMESSDRVVKAIEVLRREFVTTMFLLGTPDVAHLYGNERLILGEYT